MGFSLIEIVVVLAVVAVLVGIVAPRVDLARYEVDASARLIEGVLQQAQRTAVQRQHDVLVSFDTSLNLIRTTYDANNNRVLDPGERRSSAGLTDGTRFAAPPFGLGGGQVPAINGQSLISNDGYPTVIFRRNGAASSNLEVYLGSTDRPAAHLRAVGVVQSTGRAQLYRRAGAGWKREGI